MTKRRNKGRASSTPKRPPISPAASANRALDRRLTNTLIVGAVAVAIVLGAVFLPDWLKERSEAAEADNDNAEPTDFAPQISQPLFPDEQTATVTSFTLTNNETGEKIAASLDIETLVWSLDEAPSEPESGQVVDGTRLQQAVFALPTMTPTRELDAVQSLVDDAGLDEPTYVIEFTTSAGQTHEMEIGNANPGGSAYYARVDGADTVYLLPTFNLDPLFDLFETAPYAEPTPTIDPSLEPTLPIEG